MFKIAVRCVMAIFAMTAVVQASPGDRWDSDTIEAQVVGETVGGVLGAALLGTAGLLVGSKAASGSGDWGSPLLGGLVGCVAGTMIGAPIGVQIAGDRNDGTGHVYGTVLGELGGLVAATGVVLVIKETKANQLVLPGALVVLTILFAAPIVGYHLSADAHASSSMALMLPLTSF